MVHKAIIKSNSGFERAQIVSIEFLLYQFFRREVCGSSETLNLQDLSVPYVFSKLNYVCFEAITTVRVHLNQLTFEMTLFTKLNSEALS